MARMARSPGTKLLIEDYIVCRLSVDCDLRDLTPKN